MTVDVQSNTPVEQKQSDKELNFRALEAKYQREIDIERREKLEAQRIAQEAIAKSQKHRDDDEDDSSEPYVDNKRLDKKLARFGEQNQKQTHSEIQKAVQQALGEERRQNWIKQNPDFYATLQNNAEKLFQKDPELAETILEMPDTFERQKLVYKNIKAFGLDRPEAKQPTIQEKIDSNKRSPYYQPSGVGSAPYASAGDFSPTGQKQAYEKMKELQNRLRG